jgi:hypothetical protein
MNATTPAALTRRDVLSTIATGAALTVAGSTGAVSGVPDVKIEATTDPIFAAISAHRLAWLAYERANEAPSRRVEGPTDAEKAEIDSAFDQMGEVALMMLQAARPRTVPGIVELLEYMTECEPDERLPGGDLIDDDPDPETVKLRDCHDFAYYAHKVIAESLRELLPTGGGLRVAV